MPKKTYRHSIHLSTEVESTLVERSARFPSMNAYIEHCIRQDAEMAEKCGKCNYKAVAESVRTTMIALGVKLPALAFVPL